MEYWTIVIIIFAPPPPKRNFHADVQLPFSIEKSTPNVLKFLNTIIVRFRDCISCNIKYSFDKCSMEKADSGALNY